METNNWETITDDQTKAQVKGIIGDESYKKVASPSINWNTNEKEMAEYFDSVMDPIDVKMRSIYEESALPVITKKLDKITEASDGAQKNDKIEAFKRCLEEHVHHLVVKTSNQLAYVINERMDGGEERATVYEKAFLYWYIEAGPRELSDVEGILQAVRDKAESEVLPPPTWDSSTNYGQYTPPESKSHYVKALEVLDQLFKV